MKNWMFRILVVTLALLAAALLGCGTRLREVDTEKNKQEHSLTRKIKEDLSQSKYEGFNSVKKDTSASYSKDTSSDSSTTYKTTTYYGKDGKTPTKKTDERKTSKKNYNKSNDKASSKMEVNKGIKIEDFKNHSEIEEKETGSTESSKESISVNRSNTLYQNIGGAKGLIIIGIVLLVGFLIYLFFKRKKPVV